MLTKAPGSAAQRDVTMLVTGLDTGGAERQVVEISRRLSSRGWGVGVVSMLPPRAFVDELGTAGIPVASLGMARGAPDPRALLRLRRVLDVWQPSVLHSHMVHANLLGRLVRIVRPVPVQVSTAHSMDEGGRWRELAYRATDRLCSLTTNVAAAAVERYVQVGAVRRDRIEHVPNGVDTDRFRPDPDARRRVRSEWGTDGFWWLAVGRAAEPKDYPNLIRAFALLNERRPDARLAIVGDGPLLPSLQALAEREGVSSAVRFLGLRADVPELMAAADAFVLSSALEGLPLVILEAAAAGLPVVTTDAGGSEEALGARAYVVPTRSPGALALAMITVQELPAPERAELGRQNRRHVVEEYDLDRVVSRWTDLYSRLLREAGLCPPHA